MHQRQERRDVQAVESLTAGTDRLSVVEDRSLCRDGMSVVHARELQ